MAKLKGRITRTIIPQRQYDFAITPVLPSLDGPRDAYHVVVWRFGAQVFEQTYSVQSFTGGHYALWHLANTLQHAAEIVERKDEFPPIPLPPEAWCPAHRMRLHLNANITWMNITLSGTTDRRRGDNCLLRIYLSVEPISTFAHEPGAPLDQFVAFNILSTPDDIVRFGEDLEAEMIEARRYRDRLNLPAAYESPGGAGEL